MHALTFLPTGSKDAKHNCCNRGLEYVSQFMHTRSLISAVIIRFLESIIFKLTTDEISIF